MIQILMYLMILVTEQISPFLEQKPTLPLWKIFLILVTVLLLLRLILHLIFRLMKRVHRKVWKIVRKLFRLILTWLRIQKRI